MTYRVIKYFTDLQDNNFAYNVGDIFPHKGKDVSPSRLAELSGSDNKRGIPLIELVKDDKDDTTIEVNNKPKQKEVEPNVEVDSTDSESATDIAEDQEEQTEAAKPTPKRGRKPKAE